MMGVKSGTWLLVAAFASGGATCRDEKTTSGNVPDAVAQNTTEVREVTLPGVDTSTLTPRERREWSGYVSELLAPCKDVPVPIAQCVKEKRPCSRCLPAAKFILRGVQEGFSREQVEKAFHARYDSDGVKNLAIDGSPTLGPESAAVTIVEFADFECPVCKAVHPGLAKLLKDRPNDVRFVYKFLPIKAHQYAETAARAAIAAIAQGKFWEMHHKLFENQSPNDPQAVEKFAKELGLDMAKFKAAMNSPATNDRMAKDFKQAETLQVGGTPTIYINGRQFAGGDLDEWIASELGTDTKPAAPSAPDASGPAAGQAKTGDKKTP
jgi:protein-disulfide isomerase